MLQRSSGAPVASAPAALGARHLMAALGTSVLFACTTTAALAPGGGVGLGLDQGHGDAQSVRA